MNAPKETPFLTKSDVFLLKHFEKRFKKMESKIDKNTRFMNITLGIGISVTFLTSLTGVIITLIK